MLIFREEGKHQGVVASCAPPTGDLAHNPGMCPDWELNWRLFGSQASTQSTEPHQPGLVTFRAFVFSELLPLLCKDEDLILEGVGKGGREGSTCKRNIYQLLLSRPQPGMWPATHACVLIGNLTSILSACCKTRPSHLSHTSQGMAQSF